VSVRITDGPGALDALHEAGWDAMLRADGGRDPLRLEGVLRLDPPPGARPQRPRALVVERGGRAVAAAALGVSRERGMATVRHLGHRLAWFDPEPPAIDEDARGALAEALVAQPGDILLLDELMADGPMATLLRTLRPGIETFEEYPAYRVPTSLSTKHMTRRRAEARRLVRRAEDAGTPLVVSVTSDPAEIAAQTPELLTFKARCWEGRPEANRLTTEEAGQRWVGEAMRAMAGHGMLRLIRLDAGDRLASFGTGMVWGERAWAFQTATDRTLEGLPGLGWAGMLALIDAAAAEGAEVLDLGSGTDGYKRHIGRPDPVVTLRLPLSARGRLYLRLSGLRRGRRTPAPDTGP